MSTGTFVVIILGAIITCSFSLRVFKGVKQSDNEYNRSFKEYINK